MSDIYSAPNAPLLQTDESRRHGSIEQALAGNYSVNIGDILSEAWAKTNGCKWTFQLGFGIYLLALLIGLGVMLLLKFITGIEENADAPLTSLGIEILSQLLNTAIVAPAGAGLALMGLYRAVNLPLAAGQVLEPYGKIVPIAATAILVFIFTIIGLIALIVPGIYLSIGYLFAPLLVAEKGMSPSEAMSTSRKAISRKWFNVFGLMFVIGLINLLGMIPLGIGLLWTAPMSVIAMGILYRDMFGCECAGAQ